MICPYDELWKMHEILLTEAGLSTIPDKGAESVERVRAALLAAGHEDSIVTLSMSGRTAVDAARALGCSVEQIVKSLIFRCQGKPLLALTAGANRVDLSKLAALLGTKPEFPDGAWVREMTGFAIGGVAPIGHRTKPRAFLDADLLSLDHLWAAAGSPVHVFRTSAEALCAMTGAQVAAFGSRLP
jgi:prolyl-tRNA editing enzyme YbaK/EbsC (Cys-tRNA(Pro) deacylase)